MTESIVFFLEQYGVYAALGRVSLVLFALASTLGKVPALLMEAYAVHEVSRFQTTGKIILVFLAAWLASDVFARVKKKRGNGGIN